MCTFALILCAFSVVICFSPAAGTKMSHSSSSKFLVVAVALGKPTIVLFACKARYNQLITYCIIINDMYMTYGAEK